MERGTLLRAGFTPRRGKARPAGFHRFPRAAPRSGGAGALGTKSDASCLLDDLCSSRLVFPFRCWGVASANTLRALKDGAVGANSYRGFIPPTSRGCRAAAPFISHVGPSPSARCLRISADFPPSRYPPVPGRMRWAAGAIGRGSPEDTWLVFLARPFPLSPSIAGGAMGRAPPVTPLGLGPGAPGLGTAAVPPVRRQGRPSAPRCP